MKKILRIIGISIAIIIIWIIIFYSTSKNNNSGIENIYNSIVKIIPKEKINSYLNNPIWINQEINDWMWLGFFINNDWLIITSKHIIWDNYSNFLVITSDNKKYEFEVEKLDEKNDLVYLKINTDNKNYLKLSKNNTYSNDKIYSFWLDTNNLKVVNKKWIILNTNKKLDNISNLIEFTPEISKWFSGWPILNSKFELIWINYAIKDKKSYWINLSWFF